MADAERLDEGDSSPHVSIVGHGARLKLSMAIVVAAVSAITGGAVVVIGYAVSYGRHDQDVERAVASQKSLEEQIKNLATKGDIDRMEDRIANSVVMTLANKMQFVCPSAVGRGSEPVRCWWTPLAAAPGGER